MTNAPPTRAQRVLSTFLAVSALTCLSAGCTDLGQAATVTGRKSFRIPVQGVEVEAPVADLAGLVTEDEIAAVVATVTSPEELAALEASSTSLYDLEAVSAFIPPETLREDIETAVIDGLRERIEEEAQASMGDDGMVSFETDFSAWEAWELDLSDPDQSILDAMFTYPIVYRVTIEAESLDALLGDESSEGELGGADDDLADLSDSELIRALYVREVGLRTLDSSEVTPEDGWPSEDAEDAVEDALRDRTLLDGCQGDQEELDENLYARLVVQSLADPFVFTTLGEVSMTGAKDVCGVLVDTDDRANLKPFFQDGIRLTAELRMAMGDVAFHLGGYISAGVEARIALPGSIDDFADL